LEDEEIKAVLAEIFRKLENLQEQQLHVELVVSTIYHDEIRSQLEYLNSRLKRLENMML
jgi:hypothetical protein